MDQTQPIFEPSEAKPPTLAGAAPDGEQGAFDEEPAAAPGSFLSALPQFFVFPAILVATLTAVYLVLRALAGAAPDDAGQLLADLRQAGPHGRWQVLYSLSDGLRRGSLDLADVQTAELASLYDSLTASAASTEEADLTKQHLLLVLAHKRDPALTHYATEALETGASALRRGALQALATMGDPAAVELLEACLKGQSADERLLVLGALGSIAVQRPDAAQGSDSAEALRLRERAAEAVAGLFLDDDTILARNAVLLRARAQDSRAAPFLGRMLERSSYADDGQLDGDVPGMSDESRQRSRDDATEAFLIESAKAAGLLADPALTDALQSLREQDPSLKVRSAAIDALHAIETSDAR